MRSTKTPSTALCYNVSVYFFERYLPGIRLPDNVVAEADLVKAVSGTTLLIFVIPHQFLGRVCEQLKGHLSPSTRAISLVKGLDCLPHGLHLVSHRIASTLTLDVSVLMGANVANDVAHERFSEATIGFSDARNGAVWRMVLARPYFHINLINDVVGVELCGALKNIVALATGFVDGLYPHGNADNTKAAVIRHGLLEMRAICHLIDPQVRDETFLESCGIADLIASSYGGRNRRIAEAFVLAKGGQTFEQLEAKLLNGQKLQGPPTAQEVFEWLDKRSLLDRFPLFHSVQRICFEKRDPSLLLHDIFRRPG